MSAINPDCRDGKHPACNGDAWDDDTDLPAACECSCHSEEFGPVPCDPEDGGDPDA